PSGAESLELPFHQCPIAPGSHGSLQELLQDTPCDGHWTFMAGLLFLSHSIHMEAVAGIKLLSQVLGLGMVLWAGCSVLWKEQGVTVLAISAVYDMFVVHRLKMKQILPTIYKRKNLSLFLSITLLTFWGTSLFGVCLYWIGNKPLSFSSFDNPVADLLTSYLACSFSSTGQPGTFGCCYAQMPSVLISQWMPCPCSKQICDWRNLHTVAFYAGLLHAYCGLKSPSIERECDRRFVTNGKQNVNEHSYHSDVEYRNSEIEPSFASKFLKSLIFYATATLIVFYELKTAIRNGDWQNEEILYRSGIKINLDKGWSNLGNVLKSQSKISEAKSTYRNTLYYQSNMADMLYNVRLLLQESNRFAEALHYYKLAIRSMPTLASSYLNIGIILMNQGKTEET
ncbi:hypothetical protein EI555_012593, partial [Monodon monoceros]